MTVSTEQLAGGVRTLRVLCEIIREAKEIPNGELYAMVMGKMDLSAYDKAIGLILDTGLVTKSNDLLTWVG